MISGLFKQKEKQNPSFIQTKLAIDQPNDKYEQEADQMAAKVMRMPAGPEPLQRQCEDCEEEGLQMKPLTEGITSFLQNYTADQEEVLQPKGMGTGAMLASPSLESCLQRKYYNVQLEEGKRISEIIDTLRVYKALNNKLQRYLRTDQIIVVQDDTDPTEKLIEQISHMHQVGEEELKFFENWYKENQTNLGILYTEYLVHESDVEAAHQFILQNGLKLSDKLQKETADCRKRYTDYYKLEKLQTVNNEFHQIYNSELILKRAANLVKQEDVDLMNKWIKTLEDFLSSYQSADYLVKEKFIKNQELNSRNIKVIKDFKVDLKASLIASKEKVQDLEYLYSLPEDEQIEFDPEIPQTKQNTFAKYRDFSRNGNAKLYEVNKKDKNEVDPNDVKQGTLGDCFFLSSVAAVAKSNPDNIKQLIADNKDGTYTVKLYKIDSDDYSRRIEQRITVDSDFYASSPRKPEFAKMGDNELWVMILEKAYAKIMGGYDNIDKGGSPRESLPTLTGKAAKDFQIESFEGDEAILNTLHSNKHNAVVISSKSPTLIEKYKPYQLPESDIWVVKMSDNANQRVYCNHAYWLHDVDLKGKAISLQNPHQEFHLDKINIEDFKACFDYFYIGESSGLE